MHRNAYFRLNVKDDGLYIVLFPPSGIGNALTFSEVEQYLKRVGVKSPIMSVVAETLEGLYSETEIKLSDEPIPHVNEVVVASVSNDRMKATARFYSASNEGGQLSSRDILDALENAGIKHGIMEDAIAQWLETRPYCTDIQVAEGFLPEESIDAVIEYRFDPERVFKPTVEDDGSVNFHQLNLFNDVSGDDVLAVLTPAYQGNPGMNVLGAAIPSRKPIRKPLKFGKNVKLSEDSLRLLAQVSGHVALDGESVFVEHVYTINGDVGTATGDVVFDGIVRISGDVLTGYAVYAASDIFIGGVVEGAAITTGANVVIANGVHGGAKSVISATGNVTAKFIQEAEVFAEGSVSAGSILYSKVTAGDRIEVRFGKGLVKGGELRAKRSIVIKTVGSPFTGSNVQLEVGATRDETETFRKLEEELAGKRVSQTKLRQAASFLERRKALGASLDKNQEKLLASLPKQLETLKNSIETMLNKYLVMKDDFASSGSGVIVVEGIIYEGAKLVISGVSYYVREDLAQCKFEKSGMEVKVSSVD